MDAVLDLDDGAVAPIDCLGLCRERLVMTLALLVEVIDQLRRPGTLHPFAHARHVLLSPNGTIPRIR